MGPDLPLRRGDRQSQPGAGDRRQRAYHRLALGGGAPAVSAAARHHGHRTGASLPGRGRPLRLDQRDVRRFPRVHVRLGILDDQHVLPAHPAFLHGRHPGVRRTEGRSGPGGESRLLLSADGGAALADGPVEYSRHRRGQVGEQRRRLGYADRRRGAYRARRRRCLASRNCAAGRQFRHSRNRLEHGFRISE